MKDHEEPIHELSFIPSYEDIAVEYDPGATVSVRMHDGSRLQLRKLEEGYDPRDKLSAVTRIMSSHAQQEVLTGVLYVNTELPNFYDLLGLPDVALATQPQAVTRPPKKVLDEVMDSLG
jgi:2-oxoglutarate ferredoxin oxidoreductase subunit beta